LQKTNWIQGSTVSGTQIGVGLADLDQSGFDQFKNRKSTYHDSLYNTEIDESKLTQEQRDYAERVERELSTQTTSNAHLAEERGQAVVGEDKNENEELLYSGVERRELRNPKSFGCLNKKLTDQGSFVARLDKIVSGHVEDGSIAKRGILSNQWGEIRQRHAQKTSQLA
jgi:PAB1-binding protein PBP1